MIINSLSSDEIQSSLWRNKNLEESWWFLKDFLREIQWKVIEIRRWNIVKEQLDKVENIKPWLFIKIKKKFWWFID